MDRVPIFRKSRACKFHFELGFDGFRRGWLWTRANLNVELPVNLAMCGSFKNDVVSLALMEHIIVVVH